MQFYQVFLARTCYSRIIISLQMNLKQKKFLRIGLSLILTILTLLAIKLIEPEGVHFCSSESLFSLRCARMPGTLFIFVGIVSLVSGLLDFATGVNIGRGFQCRTTLWVQPKIFFLKILLLVIVLPLFMFFTAFHSVGDNQVRAPQSGTE